MTTTNVIELDDYARAPAGFRTLPHNLEAEAALLGAILINNAAFHQVSAFLSPEHFYEPVHSRIFDAMTRLIVGGGLADHLTLKLEFDGDEELKGVNGGAYLARLVRYSETVVHAGHYGRHIRDLAIKRGLIKACEEAVNVAYDQQIPTNGVEQLTGLRNVLDEMFEDIPRETWRSVGAVAEEIIGRLTKPAEAYSTGLPLLDDALEGGLQRGLTYAIEAPRKNFKSGTLGTIALALMRQQIPAGIISLEMGDDRVLERLIAAETGINARKFRKREDPQDLSARAHLFRKQHGQAPFFFAHEPGCTLARLKLICEEAVQMYGLRVIGIDYWQRIQGAGRRSLEEHLSATANWIADFGARSNTAMVVLSQSNREGQSYYGDGLRRAADWFAVQHKVDVADKFIAGRQQKAHEAVWMEIAENRDGPDNASIGTEAQPAFRIEEHGPVLCEYGW